MNPTTIDWAWVTHAIDDLTLGYGDPFLQLGNVEHFWLGVIMLIIYSARWLLEGGFSIKGFMLFVGLFLVTGWMLQYYNQPLPFSQSSVKTFFPDIARDLANVVANSRMDNLIQRTVDIASNLEHPTLSLVSFDVWAAGMYWLVEIDMWIISAFMLFPIAVAFIAIALGATMYPLVIPYLMAPSLSWLFWNGLTYIIKYSFYRVWAMMLTYVWAGIITQFLGIVIQPDLAHHTYSLAQFTGMVPIVMILMNVTCIWMIFYLPRFLSDFFGGTASGGGSFGPGVVNFVKSVA
jgi:hypothetical protein